MIGPLILGFVGLLMLLNVFGASDGMANFYKGRAEWFPVLDGDRADSHRMVGALLLIFGIVIAVAFLKMGIL